MTISTFYYIDWYFLCKKKVSEMFRLFNNYVLYTGPLHLVFYHVFNFHFLVIYSLEFF